jgi:predicted transcriptional regulator of viral defense system
MRATDAFRELQALGRPIVETGEAQARLRMSSTTVAKLLKRLEAAGQIQRLGRGLWLIDKATDPAAAAPYLTRPFPAYVSLWSALSRYGMIEQLPKQIFVISLDRPRTIETSIGVYSIHHVVPEVFGGYVGDDQSGFFAVPEKALFDSVYLPSAQRRDAYLPELELPSGFDRHAVDYWTQRIHAAWLRAKVSRSLDRVLSSALVSTS